MKKTEPLFSPAPFFLVRKPVLAIDDFLLMFEGKEVLFENLGLFYENIPLFKEAIAVASPSLFAMLEKGDRSKDVLNSLLKYFIRITSRPTPFGLFSSVSLGNWGESAAALLDHKKIETRARPDMEWLSGIIDEICHNPAFFPTLSIQQNPLVRKTGDRFVIAYFRKTEERKTVSIRRAALTNSIFEMTRKPVVIELLIEQILNEI